MTFDPYNVLDEEDERLRLRDPLQDFALPAEEPETPVRRFDPKAAISNFLTDAWMQQQVPRRPTLGAGDVAFMSPQGYQNLQRNLDSNYKFERSLFEANKAREEQRKQRERERVYHIEDLERERRADAEAAIAAEQRKARQWKTERLPDGRVLAVRAGLNPDDPPEYRELVPATPEKPKLVPVHTVENGVPVTKYLPETEISGRSFPKYVRPEKGTGGGGGGSDGSNVGSTEYGRKLDVGKQIMDQGGSAELAASTTGLPIELFQNYVPRSSGVSPNNPIADLVRTFGLNWTKVPRPQLQAALRQYGHDPAILDQFMGDPKRNWYWGPDRIGHWLMGTSPDDPVAPSTTPAAPTPIPTVPTIAPNQIIAPDGTLVEFVD